MEEEKNDNLRISKDNVNKNTMHYQIYLKQSVENTVLSTFVNENKRIQINVLEKPENKQLNQKKQSEGNSKDKHKSHEVEKEKH